MARILLIEDNDQLRRMLRMALEHAGYVVEEAHNGRQGVAHYRAAPADLVITNIFMPEQEGLETIRILRQEFPALKIIAISGGSQRGNLDFLAVAQRLGACMTLRKPFAMRELRAAVEKALQGTGP
jgi:two-component system chemotaxis response regulator CheY